MHCYREVSSERRGWPADWSSLTGIDGDSASSGAFAKEVLASGILGATPDFHDETSVD